MPPHLSPEPLAGLQHTSAPPVHRLYGSLNPSVNSSGAAFRPARQTGGQLNGRLQLSALPQPSTGTAVAPQASTPRLQVALPAMRSSGCRSTASLLYSTRGLECTVGKPSCRLWTGEHCLLPLSAVDSGRRPSDSLNMVLSDAATGMAAAVDGSRFSRNFCHRAKSWTITAADCCCTARSKRPTNQQQCPSQRQCGCQ